MAAGKGDHPTTHLGSLLCWWRGGGGGWWILTSSLRTELFAGAPLSLPGTAGHRPRQAQDTLTTIPRYNRETVRGVERDKIMRTSFVCHALKYHAN